MLQNRHWELFDKNLEKMSTMKKKHLKDIGPPITCKLWRITESHTLWLNTWDKQEVSPSSCTTLLYCINISWETDRPFSTATYRCSTQLSYYKHSSIKTVILLHQESFLLVAVCSLCGLCTDQADHLCVKRVGFQAKQRLRVWSGLRSKPLNDSPVVLHHHLVTLLQLLMLHLCVHLTHVGHQLLRPQAFPHLRQLPLILLQKRNSTNAH